MGKFWLSRRRRRERSVRQAIADLLGAEPLVAVDIGARGDIPAVWLPLDGAAWFLSFDADPEACERLKKVYATRRAPEKYRVFAHALGGESGSRTLYVTNVPSGSSLYDFDVSLARDYIDHDYLYPIRRVPMAIRHAGEVFAEIGAPEAHLFKLDIQGAELEVLRALADRFLRSALCIQLEAILQPTSPDHPMFCEVDSFLRESGLELFDLDPVRVHRTLEGKRRNYIEGTLGVDARSPSVAGRVWETEALYFRRPEALDPKDPGAFRRLAVCYALYGLFTEALHTLRVARDASVLSEADERLLQDSVLRWHRDGRYRWWHGQSSPARWLRRLLPFASPPVRGGLS